MSALYTLDPTLFDQIAPCPITGCAFWTGTQHQQRHGYGQVRIDGRRHYVHRFVYTQLVGAIPDGHVLHHLCEQPFCVEPSHLRPVMQSEHRRLHAHDVCRRGHSYADAYVSPTTGDRFCRACHAANSLANYHRRKTINRQGEPQ